MSGPQVVSAHTPVHFDLRPRHNEESSPILLAPCQDRGLRRVEMATEYRLRIAGKPDIG